MIAAMAASRLPRSLRHAGPLAAVTAVAMAPALAVAWRARVPADLPHAHAQLLLGWLIAAFAWIGQLWLVAGVAPIARAPEASPYAALAAGLRGLARAAVPWALAVVAIVLGLAALVVPGLVLLVLLAPTGASTRLGEPPPAPLADAAAVVRRDPRGLVRLVALAIAANVAIAVAAYLALVHRAPHQPASAPLHAACTFLRIVALAVAVIAPVPAWLVARRYDRVRGS